MDTQTIFAIIAAIAGALGISIYILSLLTKNISLELERRLTEKFDAKFREQTIALKKEIVEQILDALVSEGVITK